MDADIYFRYLQRFVTLVLQSSYFVLAVYFSFLQFSDTSSVFFACTLIYDTESTMVDYMNRSMYIFSAELQSVFSTEYLALHVYS